MARLPDPGGLDAAVQALLSCRRLVALTGAGASTESGLPDFRSPHGLYSQPGAEDILSLSFFSSHPGEFWVFYLQRLLGMHSARPNAGHRALADLERAGRLAAVLTQNIDSLHQAAGSRTVCELHGNVRTARCEEGHRRPMEDVLEELGVHLTSRSAWSLARDEMSTAPSAWSLARDEASTAPSASIPPRDDRGSTDGPAGAEPRPDAALPGPVPDPGPGPAPGPVPPGAGTAPSSALPVPRCPVCARPVRPDTVLFEEPLDPDVWRQAGVHLLRCDGLLVVGTSLQVEPVASLPYVAVRRGVPLVIVNHEPTPLDLAAAAVLRSDAAPTLVALASRLLGAWGLGAGPQPPAAGA